MIEFLFFTQDKEKWLFNYSDIKKLLDDFCSKDKNFVVTIDDLHPKRSSKQLRAFWVLIAKIRSFMNTQGNHFSDEEIATYFKDRANLYYQNHYNIKCYKSLSNSKKKQKITREEMNNLLNIILEFGEQFNIKDCFIKEEEKQELLNYY